MTSPQNHTSGPDGTLPDALNTSKPNVARADSTCSAGKTFSRRPELAGKLLAIYPATRQMVKENRRFLVRALDYVLAQAISGYIDLGAGLPTSPAVHDIVRRADDTAAVLYVDNDPVVVNHLWALTCTADSRVEAILADLAAPAAVLGHVREEKLIDLDEPYA